MKSTKLLAHTLAWIVEEEAKKNRPEPLTLVSLSFCLREVARKLAVDDNLVCETRRKLLKLTMAIGTKTHDVFATSEAKALLAVAKDVL